MKNLRRLDAMGGRGGNSGIKGKSGGSGAGKIGFDVTTKDGETMRYHFGQDSNGAWYFTHGNDKYERDAVRRGMSPSSPTALPQNLTPKDIKQRWERMGHKVKKL